MFARYLIPIFLTATTTLISTDPVVSATRQARAILAREVGAIAKKTIVRIESSTGDFGSGVIIGRTERGQKNIYTVLTAAHVVKPINNAKFKLITPVPLNSPNQRQRLSIDLDPKRNIAIMSKVDLAVVSFESNATFKIGTIGNSEFADEGSPVYVAGFPKPGKEITRIALQFTGGMVSSRLDDNDNYKYRNNGYDLAYTNITRAGMSGGPVLDAAGRIIAIHGQGDRESRNPQQESSNSLQADEKTGFNLGIPVQTFLKLQPNVAKIVGARINKSPIEYQLMDRTFTIGTKNKKFIQKWRIRSDSPPIFDVTQVNEIAED